MTPSLGPPPTPASPISASRLQCALPLAGRSTTPDDQPQEQVLTRLRRIEGQVRGLQRLVDEDAYCIDVLTQITAVDKALKGVAVNLLDGQSPT
jgi:CsoR family transcriptional regulator, copper-sensing transcriptional repressor